MKVQTGTPGRVLPVLFPLILQMEQFVDSAEEQSCPRGNLKRQSK